MVGGFQGRSATRVCDSAGLPHLTARRGDDGLSAQRVWEVSMIKAKQPGGEESTSEINNRGKEEPRTVHRVGHRGP